MQPSKRTLTNWKRRTIVACFLVACGEQQASAATLYNGWNYAIDSFTDGVSGGQIGGGVSEFYGLGIKESNDQIFVALNANLPLTGFNYSDAENGSIGWGDLFFNFSGKNFSTASTIQSLFAIRFAETNDSSVSSLGVYSQVSAKSVAQTNAGFVNLTDYNNWVKSRGGQPSMGDLAANTPYFEQAGEWTVLNAISEGQKVGDISLLTPSILQLMGLDFAHFRANGSQTIGFSFNKSLLPSGNYLANIFMECANDGVAIQGDLQPVPEPGTIVGTFMGLVGLSAALRKQRVPSK